MAETQGRREVAESVLTAVLTVIVTEILGWTIEHIKAHCKAGRGNDVKKRKPKKGDR